MTTSRWRKQSQGLIISPTETSLAAGSGKCCKSQYRLVMIWVEKPPLLRAFPFLSYLFNFVHTTYAAPRSGWQTVWFEQGLAFEDCSTHFFADMIWYVTFWSRKCLCTSFLWYFKNFDLYFEVKGKGRLSVAESSLLVTRWEVCFRCLKNSIWEREHAPGTSSFVGFRCLAAEYLQCWLTEEGNIYLATLHLSRETLLEAESLPSEKEKCREPVGFRRKQVTTCRVGPSSALAPVWYVHLRKPLLASDKYS